MAASAVADGTSAVHTAAPTAPSRRTTQLYTKTDAVPTSTPWTATCVSTGASSTRWSCGSRNVR